jgi:hypothetical protein
MSHKDSEEMAFMDTIEKSNHARRKISDMGYELLTPMFSKKKSKIIFSGLVLKKYGWVFYFCRRLVLKSNMQLVIVDPHNKDNKVIR